MSDEEDDSDICQSIDEFPHQTNVSLSLNPLHLPLPKPPIGAGCMPRLYRQSFYQLGRRNVLEKEKQPVIKNSEKKREIHPKVKVDIAAAAAVQASDMPDIIKSCSPTPTPSTPLSPIFPDVSIHTSELCDGHGCNCVGKVQSEPTFNTRFPVSSEMCVDKHPRHKSFPEATESEYVGIGAKRKTTSFHMKNMLGTRKKAENKVTEKKATSNHQFKEDNTECDFVDGDFSVLQRPIIANESHTDKPAEDYVVRSTEPLKPQSQPQTPIIDLDALSINYSSEEDDEELARVFDEAEPTDGPLQGRKVAFYIGDTIELHSPPQEDPYQQTDITQLQKDLQRQILTEHYTHMLENGIEAFEYFVSLDDELSDKSGSFMLDTKSLTTGEESVTDSQSEALPALTSNLRAQDVQGVRAVASNAEKHHTKPKHDYADLNAISVELMCEEEENVEESVKLIERASRCVLRNCKDEECKKGHKVIQDLELLLKAQKIHLSPQHLAVLRGISEHADMCEEYACPIPWCRFLYIQGYDEISFENQVWNLMFELYNRTGLYQDFVFTEEWDDNADTYIRLHPSIPDNGPQLERTEYTITTVHGQFCTEAFAQSCQLPPRYFILRKSVKWNQSVEYMKTLKALQGEGDHEHIITHLWLLSQTHSDITCMPFDEACNHNLSGIVADGIKSVQSICCILHGVLCGTRYLHSRRIVYLNWKASTILVGKNLAQVKLADLTRSVVLDPGYNDCELEDFMQEVIDKLPPYLLPPEVLSDSPRLELSSDVWGIGCLLYELYTGQCVHAELCHPPSSHGNEEEEEEEDIGIYIRDQISQCPRPSLNNVTGPVQECIDCCLQEDPFGRPPISENGPLGDFVQKYKG